MNDVLICAATGVALVSMVVVRWAMYLAPLVVFGLLTQLTARMGLDALLGMGVCVATVLSALLLAFVFC